jgi:hypothetical protein
VVKVRLAQTSFSLGEFSPLLAARSDLAQYRNGAARLLNRRLLSQGGTETRPGLRYFAEAPASACRLLPYIFAQDQRYLLVLLPGGFRVWLPNGVEGFGSDGAPWTADQLREISWVQSGDTMLLFHPAWPPQRIQRLAATQFNLTPVPWEFLPFVRFDNPAADMTPDGLGTAFTMNSNGPVFSADMVGLQMLWKGKRWTITGVAGPTQAGGRWDDVTEGLNTEATIDWQEQAWSARRGWPICATFFDGRLAVGGSRSLPNYVWLSRSAAYFNFQAGTDDGAALQEVAAGAQSGRIVALYPQTRLLIFTDGGAWALFGSTAGPVTPKTVVLRPAAGIGAKPLAPIDVDSATLFLDRTGQTLREIEIDESLNRMTANPVSLLAEHLIRQPVAMAAYQGSPGRPEVYAVLVTADGALTIYHSLRAEKVTAFAPWDTAGTFEDVCAVGPDLFVLTSRLGVLRIERFDHEGAPLDCSKLATSASRTRIFPGFGHVANRPVGIVSRGHDLGDVVVGADGTIVLPDHFPAVFEIEAGFRFRQIIRPMPVDVDLPDGPARGLQKRLLEVLLQVDRSGQVRIDGRTVLLDFMGDDVDTPPEPVTGVLRRKMLGISQDAQFDVEVVGAEKVTILGLTRRVSIGA